MANNADWGEALPIELLCLIFRKIGVPGILFGATPVCKAWRKAAAAIDCRPIWKHVNLAENYEIFIKGAEADFNNRMRQLSEIAVSMGSNYLESLQLLSCFDEKLVNHIAESAPNLKKLALQECYDSGVHKLLETALEKMEGLEEVEIIRCSLQSGTIMESVGKVASPHLKKFTLISPYFYGSKILHGQEMNIGVPQVNLPITHLQILETLTSDAEIIMILRRCPKLESLDLTSGSTTQLSEATIRNICPMLKNVRFIPG